MRILLQSSAAYSPPLSPSLHGFLALILLIGGFLATAKFATSAFALGSPANTKPARSFVTEAAAAAVASVLLGVGTLFLFLWSGVWV